MKPLVVNFYAGPSAGKSTTAAGVYYHLKNQLVKCELVTEVAKELTWSGSFNTLRNQAFVFCSQLQAQQRLLGHGLECIITDSPLPLTLFYKPKEYPKSFDEFVMWSFHQFDNVNFFISRHKPYVKIGRTQEEHEARELDEKIKDFLHAEEIGYNIVPGTPAGLEAILDQVMARLKLFPPAA